jgi:Tol biopolymer transport system component
VLLRTLVSVVVGLVACTSNHALAQPVEGSYKPEFFFNDPLFEEAGSTILFTKLSEDQSQNEFLVAEIYTMNPDGSNQVRITANATFDLVPELSPDGMTVAFQRSFGATCPCQIQLVDIDGSNERTLTAGSFPSWSPNGQQLTFNAPGVGGVGDIWVINADGTGLTNITQTPWGDSRPDFSPNGQQIAYTSSRTGNPEIWVMNSDGTNPVQVTNHPAVDAAPDWSPNGRRILFQSMRDDPQGDIYVVDHQGVHRLTTSAGRDLDPNWSPTGQRIVFDSDRNFIAQQMRQVFIMNEDGSDQYPITFPPHEDSHGSWTHGNNNGY